MSASVSDSEVVQSVRENLSFTPSKTLVACGEALLNSFLTSTLKDSVHKYHFYLSGSAKHGISCLDSDVDWMVLVFQQHKNTITLDEVLTEFCTFLSTHKYTASITVVPERNVRIVTTAHSESTRNVLIDFAFILATGCVRGNDGIPFIDGNLCDNISASMYHNWQVSETIYKVLETVHTSRAR